MDQPNVTRPGDDAADLRFCDDQVVETPHLAQLNVARLLAPVDHPATSAFVAALDHVNGLADAAPGFLWRLQTDDGDATSIRVGDDDLFIVNMSVWTSIDALWAYVYGGGHLEVMRRRREWFEAPVEAHMVLWWRHSEQAPTVPEALDHLARLRDDGPGPGAFTFRQAFGLDGRPIAPATPRQ